jgi:hydrogenase maturation protein HypF
MAFILEITTTSTQHYIRNYIINIVREFGINTRITQEKGKIICAFTSEHPDLQACLDAIAQGLPASFFLKSSASYETEETIDSLPSFENEFPLNLGLCPSCQKEMFDVSSRRYYYPFTSCSCCGGNYSFTHAYPFSRKNTSWKFIRPCEACVSEQNRVGLRENHHINSCHTCGVPVRLLNKTTERYANNAGSFRTMFEVSAKALVDNKKLLIKTTMGYRLFYRAELMPTHATLMMINASKITDHLSLITQEFNALLSIERPLLNVTLKNEQLKKHLQANTAFVKYPDDGFSILLGVELQKRGIDFIAYEDSDENCDADMLMDYDLELTPQSDMRLFLNKDSEFIAEGERVCFPSKSLIATDALSVAHNLIGVKSGDKMLFDSMEHFDSVNVKHANVLEDIDEAYHGTQKAIAQDEASFMSVIAEHNLFHKKCVGAYFYEVPSFLYYDGKKVLRVVPPRAFDSSTLLANISTLRDGSDRLIENLKKSRVETYEKLELLQTRSDVRLFEAVAIILGLEDESMRGVTREAMKFVGKGGIQIDTHVKDNRFDNTAFLASIISYQLANVSTSILCYSIFESFGDYFSEILHELMSKTKAEEVILCGTHFANQSLFSRMQRNFKQTPPLMNTNYPIGKENAVVGGAYL